MFDYYDFYEVAGFTAFIVLMVFIAVSFIPLQTQLPYENTRVKLMGLNVGWLEFGTYSYNHSVQNNFDNASLKVYNYLFSDPENASASLRSSVKNGTKLQPLQTMNITYTLTVETPAEYYIRVGCLMEGEDY